ncbi:MAG: NUDIX hydrolase [Pseudomonadota bacterium]
MRHFGPPPVSGQTYIRRHGVYAILPRGDDMLVTFQGGIHNEFQLPGGGVDPGEQPLTALHREVFEETGWSIARPRRLTAFKRFTYMPEYDLWAEKLCTIYVAHPVRSLGEPSEPDHTAVWMPAAMAQVSLDSVGDRAVVTQFYGGPL